jgi:hypothetical protein
MGIFNKLINNISEYIEVRIRTTQLAIVEKTSFILSHIIFIIILLFIGFGILLFIGFSLVELFTFATGSHLAGTLLTVATYVLLFIIVIFSRRFIIQKFMDSFIRALTYNNDEEEEIEK